ncbi:contact-dependent growth inhibition system immunity protein [Pseudomonas alvandae]|uniref:contact-dependent growth inhibition system immunity protein n=1 Tax=Pseudomonas canavaninivorans TaxID=2842348 RepID=UPI0034608D2B
METKYRELFQFFGCYFHQDWMCETPDPDEIINNFVSNSTPKTINTVKKEIHTLLNMKFSEEELRTFIMHEMPCNYCYWMDWESGEAWLRHALDIINSNNTTQTTDN